MNVFEKVKSEIATSSKDEIVKELGYHSREQGLKAIDAFLKSASLYSWIAECGFFDFKYGGVELFEQLASIFKINSDETQKAISELENLGKEIDRCRGAFILAKIPKKHLHINSMGSAYSYAWRRKYIPTEFLIFKKTVDVLQEISTIIEKHYQDAEKFGKRGAEHVENYEFHHCDKTVRNFTKKGRLISGAGE